MFKVRFNYICSSPAFLFLPTSLVELHTLTSCLLFLLWHVNALVIFWLNISRRQRQIVQQWLYEIHISKIIQVTQDISKVKPITFNYMVYMLLTYKGYVSVLISAIYCGSSRLIKMHKLSRKKLIYMF